MTLTQAAALAFALTALPATLASAQTATEQAGDPVRGKQVYRSIGYCGNCHGWPGDGKTGTMLQAPRGANLRETKLDRDSLFEVIRCGIPGTAMPYHGRSAYGADPCNGMVMSDFAQGEKPTRGKTFKDIDIVNVVAFLEANMIGLGEPTYEECAEFFENPNARACVSLK